jgi:cardiolipin synthase A/B
MHWMWALTLLEVAWVLGTSVFILLEKRSPTATLAWIFALALLPIVGALVYLLMGPRRLDRKRVKLLTARATVGRAEAETNGLEVPDDQRSLMRVGSTLCGVSPMHAHGLTIFCDGDSTYDAIAAAIASATHHVHLEYYIFRDDAVGLRLMRALMERASAGVEVRLLFDAVGSQLSAQSCALLRAAGVKLAAFNPAFTRRISQRIYNFRTHRKIVVVDGVTGFTGGINVTDDHSARARGERAWRDTHLTFRGDAVHGLQRTFLENWAFASGERQSGAQLDAYFPPRTHQGDGVVQIIASGPDSGNRAIEGFYLAALGTARHRAWLTTPYFVPSEALLSAICLAAARGVDVQLLVPHQTDSKMVDLAGASFHDQLLKAGVKVFVFGPPMLHAKTAVIDEVAIIGTANLDDRSLKLNFEVVAACYRGPAVQRLSELFAVDRERARIKKTLEANGPLSVRLKQSVARLFAPQL